MHSRFVIVMMLIVALLGLAMHTAADMAHATSVAHGDCGGDATGGAPDNDVDSSGDKTSHCCGAACHSWAPSTGKLDPVVLKQSHESITTEATRLSSADRDELRRPPRIASRKIS